ncbi:MAG: uL15 family ribosomal protein [Planctomycetota bacterium]
MQALKEAGLVSKIAEKAKIIASGDLDQKVTVTGLAVTQAAKAAIEKAGPSISMITPLSKRSEAMPSASCNSPAPRRWPWFVGMLDSCQRHPNVDSSTANVGFSTESLRPRSEFKAKTASKLAAIANNPTCQALGDAACALSTAFCSGGSQASVCEPSFSLPSKLRSPCNATA